MNDLTEDLTWYREECYSSPVRALRPVPLLGEFNDQSPAPVFRYGLGIPDFME